MMFYEDMDLTYYPYAAMSCMVFLTLYKYVSPVISERLCPEYFLLPQAKQIDWNTRTNSSIHALVVSLICLYIIIYEEEISRDPVWGNSALVKYNCAIVIGYMLADSIVMFIHYKEMGELFYIFHHGASIYAYYFVMTYGALPWFANFRLVAELSTPFVNLRWFLDVLGHPKDSKVFLVNGITMAVMFFLVRILAIPPYWYRVYTITGTDASVKLGNIWFVLISSCLVLDSINLYWFYKIYRGARKVFTKSRDRNRNIASKVD